jgi:hypothetical protein
MSQDVFDFRKQHYLFHHIPAHFTLVSRDMYEFKLLIQQPKDVNRVLGYLEPYYVTYNVVSLYAIYRNIDGQCFWGREFNNFTQLVRDMNRDRAPR